MLTQKLGLRLFGALVAALGFLAMPLAASAQGGPASALATIPAKKDNDLKLYLGDGTIVRGREALARMQGEADVVLWLAGNQFFAMDDVVAAFRKTRPGTRVALVTLPPGLLLEAIHKGGWSYGGTDYAGRPDVYGSVSIGHLQKLEADGMMRDYLIYMHNELELMVAAGNPKGIKGVDDIARADIRTSMPNPISEGIMQFYARKVIERHGLWERVSGGKSCASCQSSPTNWFTAVHHRETPERIAAGLSDTGFVWRTEVLEARRHGAAVEGLSLPPADSLRDEVSYVIGALADSKRRTAAEAFLNFLASDAGQAAYAAHGFVPATSAERLLRPIP